MTAVIPKVVKRDGREVVFNPRKIADAVYAAAVATKDIEISHELNMALRASTEVTNKVMEDIHARYADNHTITVEEIQDMVETTLMNLGYTDVAKCYILYREKRSQIRNRKSKTMETMRELTFSDSKDNDTKRENGNIDGNTAMGLMLKYGSEISKEFSLDNLIDPDVAEAHRSGDIHIHDLDFYAMGTLTCIQHPLAETLRRGFSTGHGTLRPPKSIRAFSALACIEIQACQNDMHGGQAVNAWDYDLALGVHYTFEKALITNLQKYITDLQLLPEDYDMSSIKDIVRKYRTDPDEPIHYMEHPTEELKNIIIYTIGECQSLSEYGIDMVVNAEDTIIQQSIDDTIDETYQAMEAAIHNLNTLHCLPGSEEIWVRDVGSRKWKLITMKELNDTFEENKYVVYSVNMTTGRIESKKVLASAKQDNNRAMVTITVDDNTGSKAVTRSVTVTTNHKIITSVDDEYCKDYPMNSATIVTKSGNNMTVALPISAKTMSNSGKEYVYDISVEDNENFMTKDGLFVSNSRAGSQVRL